MRTTPHVHASCCISSPDKRSPILGKTSHASTNSTRYTHNQHMWTSCSNCSKASSNTATATPHSTSYSIELHYGYIYTSTTAWHYPPWPVQPPAPHTVQVAKNGSSTCANITQTTLTTTTTSTPTTTMHRHTVQVIRMQPPLPPPTTTANATTTTTTTQSNLES